MSTRRSNMMRESIFSEGVKRESGVEEFEEDGRFRVSRVASR